MVDGGEDLLFAEEGPEDGFSAVRPWKILIVDDEVDVHSVTKLVLDEVTFEGRGLEFLNAYSGSEAREMMGLHDDICVVLLDVVMESMHEGLEVARFIREDLANSRVRIILRTGQPGQAPERKVITELDINDYKQKAELSSTKLYTSVITALRSYRDIRIIEENRKALENMALSVAHQVRNRLISISGFTNLAMKKGRSHECKVDEYLGPVIEESRILEGIVLAVSSYASLPAPKMRRLPLWPVVEQCVAELRQRYPDRTLELHKEAQVEGFEAVMDGTLAQRCFVELGSNAFDFSREQDGPVLLKLKSDGKCCSLSFIDKGDGMKEGVQSFIFDPFYTTKVRGVGMGLAVVDRLVREHRWELEISSVPGKGTTAQVHIPLI
ncbi:MAG: ATP-binding protein [Desulfovibrio sp.]|uniref:ATP-binding response regulator n=1 Tax=Desulfovibrio sp. 7SRBS1 TaxID=3378064 RepID=UPI003B41C157